MNKSDCDLAQLLEKEIINSIGKWLDEHFKDNEFIPPHVIMAVLSRVLISQAAIFNFNSEQVKKAFDESIELYKKQEKNLK